jgi:hypothetical protein
MKRLPNPKDQDRDLPARCAKVGSPVPHKTDLQLFIDFLLEQGTIVSAGPDEVAAEGHDVIRSFRPKGGLTKEHFDALVAIDPYASGMLSRAVVERLVIDSGFDGLEVHWSSEGLGYSFWDQVPDEKSFEVAAKEVEVRIYKRRAERKEGRDAPPPPPPKSVVLTEDGKPPIVLGKVKPILSKPQYEVIKALLDAGSKGLNKSDLETKGKHSDARRILKRLSGADPDWAKVISFPGRTWGRYRLL